ncbi:fungal-specific transcription factor domain-containing protein [Colletotrichum godetiae]|uniref:Fungal-specific transcription factor domain-containing protein n=1 Tax=Colletotrichum godetiae TaxID=1209918 RepID=A0AAJ0EV47_9PEZI|nr:fungal-specific transcription factor domain-containing protein [Colletotrichum godetiae]KAK1676882.1 fungal-specific transcription factor domain-containing protein [Colletotrichum godetiae]
MDGNNFCLPCFERGVLCQSHPKAGSNGPTPPRSAAASTTGDIETTNSPATSRDIRRSPDLSCRQCQNRKLRCDRKQPCGGCVRAGVRCRSAPPQLSKRDHLKVLQSRIGHGGKGSTEGRKGPRRDYEFSSSSDPDESGVGSPQGTLSGVTDFFASLPDVDLTNQGRSDIPIQTPGPVDFTPLSIIAEDTFQYAGADPTAMIEGPSDSAFREIEPLMRADLLEGILSLNMRYSNQLYFDRVHSFTPFLHQSSFVRKSKEVEKGPPPNDRSASDRMKLSHTCLHYAMWAMASSLSPQFQHLSDNMYREALERLRSLDYLDSPVEKEESLLKQTQAWILISLYELMQVGFHRAWVSTGRAMRLVQLMRLGSIDAGCDKASRLGKDAELFVKNEEKRRTFWMSLCLDTIICLVHDLPRTFSESEIDTRLPCSEDAFQSRAPTVSPFLSEAIELQTPAKQSPFMEFILSISFSGKIQAHRNRSKAGHECGNTSAQFWERQIFLDSVVARQISRLQSLPVSHRTGSVTFLARIIAHVASLSLFDVAATTPDTTAEYDHLVVGFEERALAAAKEIMRLSNILLSDFNLCQIHPFTPAPLYLCREALVRFQSRGMPLEDDIRTMDEALGEFKTVNGLCQGISKLELPQSGYEDVLATPDSIMDLLIEEHGMGG